MKELALRGRVGEDAVIQHIVDGISYDFDRKFTVYEAESLSQLRKKLDVYAKLKRAKVVSRPVTSVSTADFQNPISKDGLWEYQCLLGWDVLCSDKVKFRIVSASSY